MRLDIAERRRNSLRSYRRDSHFTYNRNDRAAAVRARPAFRLRYCRNCTTTVLINGAPESLAGTACCRPDGNWDIVS